MLFLSGAALTCPPASSGRGWQRCAEPSCLDPGTRLLLLGALHWFAAKLSEAGLMSLEAACRTLPGRMWSGHAHDARLAAVGLPAVSALCGGPHACLS